MISLASASYDPEIRHLHGPNGMQKLTPHEHRVLMYLATHRGKMASWDSIISALWEPDDEPNDAHGTMMVYISHLRLKLRKVGVTTKLIETVWGEGFAMIVDKVVMA